MVPGLTFLALNQKISGSPTTAGIYTLRAYISLSGLISSSEFTITVISGGVPTVGSDFYLSPNAVIVGFPYYYAFDITLFLANSGSLYTVTATQLSGAALPSWLTFYSSNNTFYGTPTQSFYPSSSAYPIQIAIQLIFTSASGIAITSKSDILYVKDNAPYRNPLATFPT